MDSDILDMVNEAKQKTILHWNYRGLIEIPEAIRKVGVNVQEVYLKWNKLKKLPSWISEFKNVTNLYLFGNCLENLPKSLGHMSKLVVLDLSANQLKELPDSIGGLKNLESLLLNHNCIKSLPPTMCEMENLECLCLSGNQIVALPEWLGSLPNLKELFVDNNFLREIPNRLTLSESLSMISVCSNRLRFLPPNGFLSTPNIRFDSNPYLNYLSLPVLCQLMSKVQHPLSQESGNAIAYGCFRSKSQANDTNFHIKLLAIPKNSNSDQKEFLIELPRQLLIVHNLYENKTISLWESSLRKVYQSKFNHSLFISLSPPNVNVGKNSLKNELISDLDECTKPFVTYNLLLNGPTSICMNNSCNEPIFTESWIIFGVGRNTFAIPTIVLLCSNKCAAEFVRFSNFLESHETYLINTLNN